MKTTTRKRPVVVLTTLPDAASAEKLATLLIERRLAACVNILPNVRSIYFWQEKIVHDSEIKLFIKTSSKRAREAEKAIKENHPYTVPEITTIGLKGDVAMQKDYWKWLTEYVD